MTLHPTHPALKPSPEFNARDLGEKLREQNRQVLRVMEAEKRQKQMDDLREHGDRIVLEPLIKNTSIGI